MPIGRDNYEPAYAAGLKADASELPEGSPAQARPIGIDLESNVGRSLEQLVDSNGLHAVVDALAAIAYVKADHIITTWQDRALARLWLAAGRRLAAAAESSAIWRVEDQSYCKAMGNRDGQYQRATEAAAPEQE